MPVDFFYETGREILSEDSKGTGINRGKCDQYPKIWLGASSEEVVRNNVVGSPETFHCLKQKKQESITDSCFIGI